MDDCEVLIWQHSPDETDEKYFKISTDFNNNGDVNYYLYIFAVSTQILEKVALKAAIHK